VVDCRKRLQDKPVAKMLGRGPPAKYIHGLLEHRGKDPPVSTVLTDCIGPIHCRLACKGACVNNACEYS
jgi:hypothetical protein